MFTRFVSPIPRTVESAGELYNSYRYNSLKNKYNVIPRFGDDLGFSLLITDITKSLATLSNSHSSCKKQITEWTVGNYLDVKRDTIPGLIENPITYEKNEDGVLIAKDNKPRLSDKERIGFAKKLDELGIGLLNIAGIMRSLEKYQMGDMASAFLHIKVVKIAGVKKVFLRVIDYTRSLIVDTGGKRGLMVMEADSFDENSWTRDSKPSFYHLSTISNRFNWNHKKNYSETVLLISREEKGYYGAEALTKPIMYNLYNEIVHFETVSKLVGSEFIAKALVSFEAEQAKRNRDPSGKAAARRKSYFRRNVEGIEKAWSTEQGDGTDNGNGKSVVFLQYPKGNNPPKVDKLNVNRDTAWSESTIRTNSDHIFAAHNWHPQLAGMKDFKSGLGGGILLDLYTTSDAEVIRPKQQHYEQVFSKIFNELGELLNMDFGYTIQAHKYIDELIYRLSSIKRTN